MSLCNNLGSLVRRSASRRGHVPFASTLNSVRYMSSTKIFVGGLPYKLDSQSLGEAFSGFGDVAYAKVVVDRDTGRSRGFGYVAFHSSESASSALSAMDGQHLNGRTIRVSYADDRGRFGPSPSSGHNQQEK